MTRIPVVLLVLLAAGVAHADPLHLPKTGLDIEVDPSRVELAGVGDDGSDLVRVHGLGHDAVLEVAGEESCATYFATWSKLSSVDTVQSILFVPDSFGTTMLQGNSSATGEFMICVDRPGGDAISVMGSYLDLTLSTDSVDIQVRASELLTPPLAAIATAALAGAPVVNTTPVVVPDTTPPVIRTMTFAAGAEIAADFHAMGSWYPGRIAAVHPETGTYDIAYDDGDTEDGVTEDRVHVREAPAPTVDEPKPKRDRPYGWGVALQWDHYSPTGLYDGTALSPVLNRTGVSVTLDYDSRRAVATPGSMTLPSATLVEGARGMLGKITEHGVEFDAQGWLGYRLGMITANVTPIVGVGGDGVGGNDSLDDGGFPTAGYGLIGVSFNGERAAGIDAGYDLTITHLFRGSDVVGAETRLSASAGFFGWFAGVDMGFYPGLGIVTLRGGKRF